MPALPDIYVPQLGVGVMEMELAEEIAEVMMLTIETASTQFQCFLCTKDNYKEVADKIRETIMRAGTEMSKPRPRLITNVKELPHGLRKTQGR